MGIIYKNKKVYGNNPNVIGIGVGGGYAPIGTIISFMGVTAPQDYLVCDGTIYNITEYPQLANFFEVQFGSKNYFGGNGTTTFAVPDLRGEFLRGSGASPKYTWSNGGGAVGEHQQPTRHQRYCMGGSTNTLIMYTYSDNNSNAWINNSNNADKNLSPSVRSKAITTDPYIENTTNDGYFTSRPTNTAVLYCIKAKVQGEEYSTTEVVVGTWVDGKPIYQKTISGLVSDGISGIDIGVTVDKVIKFDGWFSMDNWYQPFNTVNDAFQNYIKVMAYDNNADSAHKNKLWLVSNTNVWNSGDFAVTLQYTKTTD